MYLVQSRYINYEIYVIHSTLFFIYFFIYLMASGAHMSEFQQIDKLISVMHIFIPNSTVTRSSSYKSLRSKTLPINGSYMIAQTSQVPSSNSLCFNFLFSFLNVLDPLNENARSKLMSH
ncbi:hypothetical protein L2E82_40209 [Cichorium intybus]|uniref:Uncharacterized protein n=1 Tax=Cichorium intybus TaxID=13427 RepID=A0ACB9AJN0_CICIN|nr:hypothetical protein L2E82_40209 [Cichorium intybus]